MLHELLLVLSGYPGDVFLPSPPHAPNTFAIASDFPLLHDAERSALNRLANLGWQYAKIDEFVRGIRNSVTSSSIAADTPHGSYIQALAVALNDVLREYRDTIVSCEQRILGKQDHLNGAVPIIHIAAAFAKWTIILPALTKLLSEIAEDPTTWHGCRLLGLIIQKSHTGVAELRDIANQVLHHLHVVMYKQIISWMVYGHLFDPYQEFFIAKRLPASNASPAIPTSEQEPAGSSGQFDHCLEKSFIPSHVPLELAESILFVGEIVKTVRDNSASYSNMLPKDMVEQHLQLLLQLSNTGSESYAASNINILRLQKAVSTIRRATAEWMFHQVLVGDHDILRYLESFKDFYLLGQGDFARNLIDECDQLATADANTDRRHRYGRRQLDALLHKAQFGCLCEDSPELARYSLRVTKQVETDQLFSFFLLNGTPCSLKYHYRWPLNLFLTTADMNHYDAMWEFLISLKKVQSKLNSLWIVLRGGWSSGSTSRREDEYEDGPWSVDSMKQRERLVWRVRSKMLFWIDALWCHVQNDIINPSYTSFIDSIRPSLEKRVVGLDDAMEEDSHSSAVEALDFEQIQKAHKVYLTRLFRGCLLESTSSSERMSAILQICLEYCQVIKEVGEKGDWSSRRRAQTADEIVAKWTHGFGKEQDPLAWVDDVLAIEKKFAAETAEFFKSLSRVGMSHGNSEGFDGPPVHLDLFLARLDYNKWFSIRRFNVEGGR
ncbi:gamma-tubulin complex component protein [Umbelopsis sp. AD052]|nr:gamma-tubulin complex component protein [Umbelopsis sp. AD052]